MNRRSLLQFSLLAPAAALAQAKGVRHSIRVEMVFGKIPLADQIRKVAQAGYDGFEFGDWRPQDPVAISKLARELHLKCVCTGGHGLFSPPGTSLTKPADRAGFLAEIKASTEAAKRFGSTRMVVVTGFDVPGMTHAAEHASVVEALKRAHDIVAPSGIPLVVEPLNTAVDHPGYFLNSMREGFEIMREVGSPYVKVLFDIYHAQIIQGNLIDTIRKNIAAIGHFHVADVPGRHEPGTGEIDYRNVFKAIRETGYQGFVGMEYVPSKDPLATLLATRKLWE